MSQSERDRMEGRLEMIDYCLNTFCKSELTPKARLHLKNIEYDIKLKLNECDKKVKG